MTIEENILLQLKKLSPEQRVQVLELIARLLKNEGEAGSPSRSASLKAYPAFGSWKERNIDALEYQQQLRDEWGM